eukprot:10305524-Karenia_brevis.AAC.1
MICAAKWFLQIKRTFSLYGLIWQPNVSTALRFNYEGHSQDALDAVAGQGCVWFYSHLFNKNKCWMARATETLNSPNVTLNIPFEFRPIWYVLESIHNIVLATSSGTGAEDVQVEMLDIFWGLQSVQT